MRTVELAKVAAAAEALRLRRIARRQAVRAAYGAVAAVFAIAVLVVLHVVAWHLLAAYLTPIQSSLVLLLIDAIIAGVCGFLAVRSPVDPVEQEALVIRQQAVIELRQSLTFMGIVASATGVAVRTGAREGVRRGATSALTRLATRLVHR